MSHLTFKGHRLGVDGIISSLPIVKTANTLMNNDKKMAEALSIKKSKHNTTQT